MILLTGVIRDPIVLGGDPHVLVAECTSTTSATRPYRDGGIQLNRYRIQQTASHGEYEIKVGSYSCKVLVGRLTEGPL